MSRHLARAGAMAAVLALTVAAAALGAPKVVRAGNLFLRDNGGIVPRALPRHEMVPISAFINAELRTTDGTRPPAIRTVTLDLDKTIAVEARGLPTCRKGEIVARTTAAARKACPNAIVGSGEGEVEVAFPESEPFRAKGPILLFNGGVHGGRTILYIHTYVSVPAPTAVIGTVELTRVHSGHFGLRAVTTVPRIAGGDGSVTRFKVRIGRRFTYRGRQRSYLLARCPTGRYYTEGHVLFADGTTLGLTHVLPCTPKG